MRIPVGAKMNLVFIAGLLLLAAVGALAYRSIGELVETGRAEGRASEHTARIEHIVANLRTAESVQRRYLIAGGAGAASEIDALRSEVTNEISELRRNVRNAAQVRRLDRLGQLAEQRFDFLAQGVRAERSGGLDAAIALLRAPDRAKMSEEIARLVERFEEQESRSLSQRRADTEVSAGNTSFIIVWGGCFALVLLVWAMVVINQYHAHRLAALAALRASEAQMRLVTNAIPALVAYIDSGERFRFHNKAFERWFKRSFADVEGRKLRDVIGSEAYDAVNPNIARVLAGEEVQFNFAYQSTDAKVIDVAAHLVPRRDERGGVAGFFALVTDVSELRRLERLKAEFVATVSHELRTPLTSIRGSLGLLGGGAAGVLPEAARSLVDIAHESSERLVRLINDLLDFDKIESRKMSMTIESLDLRQLVDQSVQANEGYAAEHGVAVQVQADPGSYAVLADKDRVAQVLSNLLSNACKFSARGGIVEVEIAKQDKRVRVRVSDRGPGVPEEFRPRMFQRFAQADSSNTRSKGGTGLGLAISRAIMERLKGRIGFEPRQGGGATFYFDLPENEA